VIWLLLIARTDTMFRHCVVSAALNLRRVRVPHTILSAEPREPTQQNGETTVHGLVLFAQPVETSFGAGAIEGGPSLGLDRRAQNPPACFAAIALTLMRAPAAR
jgi:hypothetical protein